MLLQLKFARCFVGDGGADGHATGDADGDVVVVAPGCTRKWFRRLGCGRIVSWPVFKKMGDER